MLLSRRLGVVVALLLGILGALSPAAPARASEPGLTGAQERVVLSLIDDACGDTWCEGDYAFVFRRLDCRPAAARCDLRLEIAPWSSAPLRWRRRVAHVHGFTTYGQMVTTSPGGYRSLTPSFATAVGTALHRVEHSVSMPGAGAAVSRA